MRSPASRSVSISVSIEGFVSPSLRTLRLSFTRVATVCHVVTKTSPRLLIAAARSSASSRRRSPWNCSRRNAAVCPVTPLNGANQNHTASSSWLNRSTIVPAISVLPEPVGASISR